MTALAQFVKWEKCKNEMGIGAGPRVALLIKQKFFPNRIFFSSLSERHLEQRKKMLRNYPLPDGWTEVYDAGMRRHYYWNRATDEVGKLLIVTNHIDISSRKGPNGRRG